ncbi:hypothetical protein ERJ75_000134500 [Trypanosoma vivax]|uniref:Transmembrane protein n=1 Tax=Trypanosoma vivax (strain Y486) TaxID=1055687 RepID=G0TT22_TRYVY|nr:hypothetical protein ERJ75_000134500 [Trypanosoma vivax]CCC47103.1 conserved hypothetical protein [Trypanosoma vivax Y486]
MPSCERLHPNSFHGREARLYTEQCVRQLTQTKEFRSYVKHVEYGEKMQMTWFMAVIGLTLALYYHIIFLPPGECKASSHGPPPAAPLLPLMTVFLVFIVAPCVVIAQFSGLFEFVSRQQALSLAIYLTCVNIAVVSFGGELLHNPPYILSTPTVDWLRGPVSELKGMLAATVSRAMPLQGIVFSGFAVHVWRQGSWKRACRLPLPLVSGPLLVGTCSCLWFRIANIVLPLVVGGSLANVTGDGLTHFITTVAGGLWEDGRSLWTGSCFNVFTDPKDSCHLWFSAVILSSLYFSSLLFLPVIRVALSLVSWMLPTHPTTWGLMFISSLVCLIAMLLNENSSAWTVFALGMLLWLLGRNGFSL